MTDEQWGEFDTVYITASGTQQSLVAPLVAGLLTQIREAVFAQHRVDEAKQIYSRPPVVWALDELAQLPMQDLPETLTQSGGQGLLIAACLQDLGLVERKWDVHPETFLTLFGDIVVHPGIRDIKTLEALSTIIGKHWVAVSSTSSNQGVSRGKESSSQEGWERSTSQELLPILEPGAISRGLGDHPDRVLHLRGQRWSWAFSMPYWKAPPWPQLLVGTMGYASRRTLFEGRWELPYPELDRGGDGRALFHAGGRQLQIAHHVAFEDLRHFRERRRQHLAYARDHPLLRFYDDTGIVWPTQVEMWLFSPQPLSREEFSARVVEAGYAVNTAQSEWLSFTDETDGTPLTAPVDWLINLGGWKAQLRWQDPNYLDAVGLYLGRKWTDNASLDRYAKLRGVPGFMVQGWGWSSLGWFLLYTLAIRLADEMPIGIVINTPTMERFECRGDWSEYGGVPEFPPDAFPRRAPEPEPGSGRAHTFHIDGQAYVAGPGLHMTADDFKDPDSARRKISDFFGRSGNQATKGGR